MQWFLKQKIEENADYDAFCVFDADNIAMPDFIKNMNKVENERKNENTKVK